MVVQNQTKNRLGLLDAFPCPIETTLPKEELLEYLDVPTDEGEGDEEEPRLSPDSVTNRLLGGCNSSSSPSTIESGDSPCSHDWE